MSQSDVDYISHLEQVVSRASAVRCTAKNVISSIKQELTRIKDNCDHNHPDGQSAWLDGYNTSVCSICGLADF